MSAEAYRIRKWLCACQLMPENEKSRPQEDHSSRKTTSRVEGVGRRAAFFAQSSVLSTQSYVLTPEH
jgi:hypothetical protein